MELKKKTIIWEDNNEPPKNYVWVKSDGNAYEFNHTTRQWEKIMSSNGSDSGEGGGGGDDEIQHLLQIKTLIEQVPDFAFDETEENPTYVIPIADFDESTISSGDDVMGDKDTADYVIRLEIVDPADFHEEVYICYITSDELGYLKQIVNNGGGGDDTENNNVIPLYHPAKVVYWLDTSYEEGYGNAIQPISIDDWEVEVNSNNLIEPENIIDYINNKVSRAIEDNPEEGVFFSLIPVYEFTNDLNPSDFNNDGNSNIKIRSTTSLAISKNSNDHNSIVISSNSPGLLWKFTQDDKDYVVGYYGFD